MRTHAHLRRTCTRCGGALWIAGSLCICMRGQTTADDPNGAIRTSQAIQTAPPALQKKLRLETGVHLEPSPQLRP